jgi:acyl carrier protein
MHRIIQIARPGSSGQAPHAGLAAGVAAAQLSWHHGYRAIFQEDEQLALRHDRLAAHRGAVMPQLPFEQEIARLIAEVLQLETAPEEIDPEAPLFGEGLGLDSIDALELALALSRSYGTELKADDVRNRQIFASLRNLAEHVQSHRR